MTTTHPSPLGGPARPTRRTRIGDSAAVPALGSPEAKTFRYGAEAALVVGVDGVTVFDCHGGLSWSFADMATATTVAGRCARLHFMSRQREALRQLEETRRGRPRPESDPL